MTSEREFETLLRSWFEDTADGANGEAVLASVAMETGRVRPRPGWLVRLGGDPMPAGDRSWLNRMVTTGIAAAVVLAVAALAIGILSRPDRSIGPSPLPRTSSEATTTSQPTPTSTPSGQTLDLSEATGAVAHLVSDTVGWLQTDRAFYRTSDGGQTWRVVTMPRGTPPDAIRIVDADSVFVAYAGSPWTLAATHDGGVTWVVATIEGIPAEAYVVLSTRDGTHGTATFDPDLRVYTTVDGGASWSGPSPGTRPTRSAIGCKFDWDPGNKGVISCGTGKFDNLPFDDLLSLSTDGAQTWLDLSFPTDDVSLAGEGKSLAGIPLIVGNQILLAVDNWTAGSTAIYRSSDLGRSWQFVSQIPNWQGSIDFLSESQWVGCGTGSGASCWSTRDGGASWRQRKSDEISWFDSVTFGTVDHGWGVVYCRPHSWFASNVPQCAGSQTFFLFETLDGGLTWRQLG
jgi:photosystem II stability/assembly factor-like uncharacterized protein